MSRIIVDVAGNSRLASNSRVSRIVDLASNSNNSNNSMSRIVDVASNSNNSRVSRIVE